MTEMEHPVKKIQPAFSMPDESGSDTPESTSKRKQVSKRLFLKLDGTEADRIEEATGARYTLLDPAGNQNFDQQFGAAGKLVTMCAIFGFHTKVGNVANTVLNDKDEPGDAKQAGEAIADFIKQAESGTWAERAAGGVGARIDKDALAGAIVEVAQAAGKTADYAKIRAKLEEDPQYVRAARQVPDVATAYATRVGKATKSIDDLI
jgi:hypothetical protein